MDSNQCTLWESLEEKNLAGKIYWDIVHAINNKMYNVDIYVVANKLKINPNHALELYRKYTKYQNEPVTCNEILYVSKLPYMSSSKRYSIVRTI